MSKILCIPDIHGRNFWRNAVFNNTNKVDKVIFLGDYLDPYPNEIKENPESMEVKDFHEDASFILNDIISLKKSNPDKYILLTGNHTDSYIWPNFAAASRTDYHNWQKYHKILLDNLNMFKLVLVCNDVIFSHAGITEGWAKEFLNKRKITSNTPVKMVAEILQKAILKDSTDISELNCISSYRGGDYLYGSCEWADLMEHIDQYKSSVEEKIVPLGEEGVYQIFGHTQLKSSLITDKWACLDCRKGFIIDTITHEINEC